MNNTLNIISFTKKGMSLQLRIKELLSDEYTIKLFAKCDNYDEYKMSISDNATSNNDEIVQVCESIKEFAYQMMMSREPLIFVGAIGIAVRSIADGIKDKLTDSPVIVIDEKGSFVIPILSGHVGGANDLAIAICKAIDAIPVITTATDIENAFSVDLFAKENNLAIVNRDGIAKVSAKALEDKPIRLSIENYPPTDIDVLISTDEKKLTLGTINLCPKKYALGVGCRKGTDSKKLERFIDETLSQNGIDKKLVGAIGSIDLKANEKAIIDYANTNRMPYITFTAQLLSQAKGEYEESEFVAENTGVGNVCERVAMLLTGNRGSIVIRKIKQDGMTLAIGCI